MLLGFEHNQLSDPWTGTQVSSLRTKEDVLKTQGTYVKGSHIVH